MKGPSSQMTLSNQNLNYEKILRATNIDILFLNYQKKFEKKVIFKRHISYRKVQIH